jgi:murein DD-endopeptidase MepM/ murein hydrolase activator NlpD
MTKIDFDPSLPHAARPDDRRRAAAGIESYFLRQMLAELAKTGGASGGGFAANTFDEMLQGAIADKIAAAGGIGLADKLMPASEGKPPLPLLSPGRTPEARLAAAYRAGASPLVVHPLEARISSRFGLRRDPIDGGERIHEGVDLAAPLGTPVRTSGAGVVLRAGAEPGYGNLVVVDHGGGLETRYAHLASMSVAVGDRVAAGGAIGAVGSTGRSTGPHLHFEIRRDGKSVDPASEMPALRGCP